MKIFPAMVLASAVLLGGCASSDSLNSAAADSGGSYVSLGSNIPKKNRQPADGQTADLQQLENARIQNNGMNAPVR